MKNYFEYKDEKSAKFWEINLDGLSVTTTYGKIGTTGQVSEKTFETEEKAEKEYYRLIAEKTKKGYKTIIDTKNTEMETRTGKTINLDEALDLINSLQSEMNNEIIEALENFDEEEEIILYNENVLLSELQIGENNIIINGNLKVDKTIEDNEFTVLIVVGNVETTNLITLADIIITGNLTVENIILGDSSNNCQLLVGGNLTTKTIIEGGHWFVVKGTAKVDYLYNSHCNLKDKNGIYKPNLADGDLMYDFNESPKSYKGFSYVEMIDDMQEGDNYHLRTAIKFIKNGGTKFHK